MTEIDWGQTEGLRINGKIDSCTGCRACCIVLEIPELGKERGIPCKNLMPDGRCRIYETRPQVCRDFDCKKTFGLVRIALNEEAGFEPPIVTQDSNLPTFPLNSISRRTS